MLPLNDVPADPRGPIAVLGPGTGLGQAQLFWDADEGHYRVWPSEGAHAGFAPRGWRQRALSGAVEDALGYCEVGFSFPFSSPVSPSFSSRLLPLSFSLSQTLSPSDRLYKNFPSDPRKVEHVACGAGLERIYAFLSSDSGFGSSSSPAASSAPSSSSTTRGAAAEAAEDGKQQAGTVLSPRVSAPAITAAAALGTDQVAAEAVDMFLSIIGAEAGAMALRSLATGGVFLCGGITAKLGRATRSGGGNGSGASPPASSPSTGGLLAPPAPLLDAFLWRRSKFSKLLSAIPFSAVLDDGLGLRGARVFASRSLTRAQAEE